MRSAFLHVLGDTLSSVAVIGAAVWIYFTGQVLIDPILSAIIGVIIIGTAVGLLRETIAILLQFAPRSVSFDEVIAEIRSVTGVEDVHHLPPLESSVQTSMSSIPMSTPAFVMWIR